MTNAELKELIHLLLMCGIMDKTALESGNVTNEDWLRMESLIDKYQADKTEPEVHGDLISRDALLKAMEEERQYLLARGLMGAEHILVHHCLPLIDNAPTVEPERTQGEWIPVGDRLPEERINPDINDFGYVLCSTIWGDVRPYKFGKRIEGNKPHFWLWGDVIDDYVVAWQPLPDPYQKGGAEE